MRRVPYRPSDREGSRKFFPASFFYEVRSSQKHEEIDSPDIARMRDIFFDKKKAAAVVLLLLISSIGFYIRYDNIDHWMANKIIHFSPVDNTPLPLEVDSYYYLDVAQDILAGKVKEDDRQRQAPDSYHKFISLPFLSVVLAMVSKISGKPLEWIAVLIPPFLGILLTVPLYFLAILLFRTSTSVADRNTFTVATTAGLISALFAIVSPIYVERSSIGWCDTDILNVTLLCSLTCIALYAAVAEKRGELIRLLVLFTLLTFFFIQWWDQATTLVVAFSLGYLVLAGLFSTFSRRGNGKIFVLFVLLLSLLIFGMLNVPVLRFPSNLLSLFQYSVSMDDSISHFRFAGQLVAEQQDTSLSIMGQKIAGNEWVFYLSLAGVVLLVLMARKYILFLLPWLVLLYISTKSHRVMIFPSVLFGLGLGTIAFVFLASSFTKQFKSVFFSLVVSAVVALAWFPVKESQSYFPAAPPGLPQLFDNMKILAKRIPADSVIWTSWGHGHPLVYYTNARTIGDGIFHPPELVYSQYVPYAVSSSRLAANWIMFYAAHGIDGLRKANKLFAGSDNAWSRGMPALQELLDKGIEASRFILLQRYAFSLQETEETLSFLFPQLLFPVYFLLDYITYEEQWFRWGRASFYSKDDKFSYTMVPIQHVHQDVNMINGRSPMGNVSFDIVKGVGTVGSQGNILFKHIRVESGISTFEKNYHNGFPHKNALPLLLVKQNKYLTNGVLLDDHVLNTIFTKMFFLNKYDKEFFIPIMNESPLMAVYQVHGEVYNQQRKQ